MKSPAKSESPQRVPRAYGVPRVSASVRLRRDLYDLVERRRAGRSWSDSLTEILEEVAAREASATTGVVG